MWKRRIALAWDVLWNGLPKQTDTIYAQKFVSRFEMVKAVNPKDIVDSTLGVLIRQLLTEAAHRIIITKEEDYRRMGYVYTGSLQLGKKGIKTTINRGVT